MHSNGPGSETIIDHTAELIELHNKKIRAETRIKELRAQHEAMGGSKKLLDQQYKYAIRPRDEVRSELDGHLHYSSANSLIFWDEDGQGRMFSDDPNAEHLLSGAEIRRNRAVAYAEGYKAAGKSANLGDCPYPDGSDQQGGWCMGWEHYFEDAPSAMRPPSDDEEAVERTEAVAEEPPKKKRGRPRKHPLDDAEMAGSA